MLVGGATITGTNAGDFAVTGGTCFAGPLAPSANCEVGITFTPSAQGTRSADLEVKYNGGASPLTIPLTGTGAKARISKVRVSGPAKVTKGKKATYKVKITNSGNATATGVKLKASGRGTSFNAVVGKIAAGKNKTVKVKLKPKKPGRIKATFKVTSSNAGSKTVKKTITVK